MLWKVGDTLRMVSKRKQFVLFEADDGYVLQNVEMDDFAHTHLESWKMAMKLISYSMQKKVPHDLSRYLLISLLRINDDEEYCRKIEDLLDNKKRKDMYFNPNKGMRGVKCQK